MALFAISKQAIHQDIGHRQAQGQCVERIITTCLDNDDALALDFVERTIRTSYSLEEKTFVSFRSGMQYFTDLGMATHIRYPNNHFLSLIEDPNTKDRIRTVFGYGDHTRLFRFEGVDVYVDEREAPAWLEVVHEANIANDVYMHSLGAIETREVALREYFELEVSLNGHTRGGEIISDICFASFGSCFARSSSRS